MFIPKELRRCVFFIAIREADGKFSVRGTAFSMGLRVPNTNQSSLILVTAKHVIDRVQALGLKEIWVRPNGGDWARSLLIDWYFHPTDPHVDAAAAVIDFENKDEIMTMGPDFVASKEEVALGDEVFVTGLFRHHWGKERNIPIIRMGNIAAVDEEQVTTSYGLMDAYLVEVRSIGGLSGSPVFRFRRNFSGIDIKFIGLIHGHYQVRDSRIDDSDGLSIEQINMGIAIVVPFYRIQEVINQAAIKARCHGLVPLSMAHIGSTVGQNTVLASLVSSGPTDAGVFANPDAPSIMLAGEIPLNNGVQAVIAIEADRTGKCVHASLDTTAEFAMVPSAPLLIKPVLPTLLPQEQNDGKIA